MHCWIPGSTQQLLTCDQSDSVKVMKLICESEKYMWIGTNLGLLRRNNETGQEWLVSVTNSKLRSNDFTCGVCLPDGRAYIGTKDELLYWNNDILIQFTSKNSNLAENYIRELMVDQNEKVWVRTIHGRIGKLNGINIRMLESGEQMPAYIKIMYRSRAIPTKFTADIMKTDSTKFNR
jgi:ligand-binding sensor domain-containing protein